MPWAEERRRLKRKQNLAMRLDVVGFDGAFMGSGEPAFDQGGDAGHAGQKRPGVLAECLRRGLVSPIVVKPGALG